MCKSALIAVSFSLPNRRNGGFRPRVKPGPFLWAGGNISALLLRARVDTLSAMYCETCIHAREPAEPAMRGFVQCALLKEPWRYHEPKKSCVFRPTRWEIKL